MKKIALSLMTCSVLLACSCNNNEKETAELQAQSDSLYDQIIKGHNVGMDQIGRLSTLKDRTSQLIDSLNHLPGQARQAAIAYKAKLETLLRELDSADQSMTDWMKKIKLDSLENDIRGRVKYMTQEKDKVEKVKAAIVGSIQKADSLLREKF